MNDLIGGQLKNVMLFLVDSLELDVVVHLMNYQLVGCTDLPCLAHQKAQSEKHAF